MRFSCGKCGRSYVAADGVREHGFKMTCRVCGATIVVEPVPVDPPRERDPFAPAAEESDGELVPLPPEPAEASGRRPFDPFGDMTADPPGGAQEARGAPEPRSEADDAFADLARELGGSVDRGVEGEHRTGELPLVADKRGELTPTPPAAPQVARAAAKDLPPASSSPLAERPPFAERPPSVQRPPSAEVPLPAKGSPAKPPTPPPARPKRSLAVPVVVGVLAVGAGALGLARLRSSQGADTSRAPRAPQVVVPAAPTLPPSSTPVVAAPAPAAPVPPPPVAMSPPAEERHAEPASRAQVEAPPPRAQRPGNTSSAKKPAAVHDGAAAPAAAKRSEPPPKPTATSSRQVAAAAAPAPAAAPPQPPPQASTASDAPLPPLDDAGVDAVFARERKRFDVCIAAARAEEPGVPLQGRTVTLTMTVNTSGKVLYPTLDDAALSATELGRCLKREAAKMQFPPFGGDSIRVHKPITLG